MGEAGGGYRGPFPPHGSEGLAVVGKGGERQSLSPRGGLRGGNPREDISMEPPRATPHVH